MNSPLIQEKKSGYFQFKVKIDRNPYFRVRKKAKI